MSKEFPVNENIIEFIPALRAILSDSGLKTLRLRMNDAFVPYCQKEESLRKVVEKTDFRYNYAWNGKYIYMDSLTPLEIIEAFISKLKDFRTQNSGTPQIIIVKDYGVIAVGEDSDSADLILDEFKATISESGHKKTSIQRSKDNHEESFIPGILNNRICIVTGGAQGFGEGISRSLLQDGANLVIADLNEEKGQQTTSELKTICIKNNLFFVKTDVSDPESVRNLVVDTVKNFGGIDVFVSNAGILKAGGLEEMDPASFSLMTKINYEGYFLCAKYASLVMKLQSKYKEDYYSDIIQINSKSGLKGSNRNFAYAGGKFGGIGLTQSFALELAPFRIKVNAICPGNFFEGPLWSDPERGLFIQYLKAGKVPGAKTIEDVKRYYEKQVPLGRGCRVQDVMRALTYIVSQVYETGQAVPVTGGQEMLS